MMSADPVVPDPMNGQAWNRYSYVINNPLALTDTNGYCFLGMCSWGHAIGTFLNRTLGAVFRAAPILGTLLEIGAVALCGGNPLCMIPTAFSSSTFVAGVTSGNLGYALRAGLIAGATAAANFEIGTFAQSLGGVDGYLLGAAGHALVSCVSAVASQGKCGPAAIAAGISSLAAQFTNGYGRFASLVMNSVVGGLASAAGGGKFANGATTAAFAYLTTPQAGASGASQADAAGASRSAPAAPADQAQDMAEEENGGRGLFGEFLDPTAELRQEAFFNAYNQLRAVAPNDPYAVFMSSPGWVPSNDDVNQMLDRLSIYTSPLVLLHPEETLSSGSAALSRDYWSGQSNDAIINYLRPGEEEPLTVGSGGVVWQGNTRISILQDRGVDINALPRVPYPRY
jgi:hypothetical protein